MTIDKIFEDLRLLNIAYYQLQQEPDNLYYQFDYQRKLQDYHNKYVGVKI